MQLQTTYTPIMHFKGNNVMNETVTAFLKVSHNVVRTGMH
jgi:hypothetical protein